MKIIAVIPARYAATRFPAKLMQSLGNKTVIRHTYDNTVSTGLFNEVIVATDHELIYNEIKSNSGQVVMTRTDHESGSDRIAEAVRDLDADVIINVQGDEPFMKRQPLEDLIAAFQNERVGVASLMHPITDPLQIDNPNVVKVVTDLEGFALYFSRSRIPFNRGAGSSFSYHRHIGVYGYRKSALLEFVNWPMSPLENLEKLEQLRYLENGVRIKMVTTDFFSIGIDTPEDYLAAQQYVDNKK
jgi:3-deoxy-manno-octulosonate cytidylyltransferase (CMP-KDO synthetase)